MGQFSKWIFAVTGLILLLVGTVACRLTPTADTPFSSPEPPPAAVQATTTTERITETITPGQEETPLPTTAPSTATVTAIVEAAATVPVLENEMTPHMQVVSNFLTTLQNGAAVAESEIYLTQDMQAAVIDGRPLPTLAGIRDAIPSFELTDLTDNSLISGAIVRARFNFDYPTYAVFRLVLEDGEWRIRNIAQHNLVRTVISRDLLMAEFAIINYYQALANDQLDEALALLTGEAQATFTADALTPIATSLRRVTITTLQPVRATEDQINFYVRLFATPHGEQPGPWRDGDNPRWLTLVRTDDMWRIARIINSPILADIKIWQRVNILPINTTLDIPSDWTRASLNWAWSPNSLGMPAIGVGWADLGDFVSDDALLPRHRQAISQQPVNLGWAQGTQYSFQQLGGIGEEPINAQTHIVVRTGRRAYDFYAVAQTVEELDDMRPILQRMVAAVVIHDPEATAYNSIEATTSFLAALIRDSSGQSSLLFLSDELKEGGSDYPSLLHLLDINTAYQSFQATWMENTADEQAKVLVTLHFTGNAMQTRLFTLQLDDADTWRIIKIEATVG